MSTDRGGRTLAGILRSRAVDISGCGAVREERLSLGGSFHVKVEWPLSRTHTQVAIHKATQAAASTKQESDVKPSLKPGLRYEHRFVVPPTKTVPALYPEAEEFLVMPEVFATGFLVGFLEWACVIAIKPHLDWPLEQSVGTHINVSHTAATPPGMQVTAQVELLKVDGKKLVFAVRAHDTVDIISAGVHERHVIIRERFVERVRIKGGGAYR